MPNFKPKPIKKVSINNKTIITLDNKHDEMLDSFNTINNDVITKLLTEKNGAPKWDKLLLMFQLEVANRIVAKPHTKQYGRLSLFSQFYSLPSLKFQISKNSFFPVPKVESALVKFQKNCHIPIVSP